MKVSRAQKKLLKKVRRWLDKKKKDRVEIVLYHSVTKNKDAFFVQSNHNVEPDVFREQIRYLKAHYKIIPLRGIIDIFSTKTTLNGPFVCVCFDDGYRNNLTEAYPILEELEVPATLFVCPSILNNKDLLWRDKIRYLIAKDLVPQFLNFLKGSRNVEKYHFGRLKKESFYVWSKDDKSITDMSIQRDIDDFFYEEGLLPSEIAKQNNIYISRNDLKEREYLDFGNHTWSHPIMVLLNYEQQKNEILRAHKSLLESGVELCGLAMPFSPFNEDTVKICRGLRYKYILTVYGLVNCLKREDAGDLLILHRLESPSTLNGLMKIL